MVSAPNDTKPGGAASEPQLLIASSGGQPLTLGRAQAVLAAAFAKAGLDIPALDARLLVTGALGLDRAMTLQAPDRPIDDQDAALINEFGRRRLAREPVSRILGAREFYGLEFEISPATLDPRPDTETLVEGVLRLFTDGVVPGGRYARILDAGTGSGAILVTLLHHLPEASGLAVDIEPAALRIAERNAIRHGVNDRFEVRQADWLDGIAGSFGLIVSNPPYITTAAIDVLDLEVRQFDPRRALDGGKDGLDAYRRLIPVAVQALLPGGWLVLETGQNQDAVVLKILEKEAAILNFDSVLNWPDMAGIRRCVAIRSRN